MTPPTASVTPLSASMKALPKRKGNAPALVSCVWTATASMKALPKRKGNAGAGFSHQIWRRLNESPSKKEGKCRRRIFAPNLATPQ